MKDNLSAICYDEDKAGQVKFLGLNVSRGKIGCKEFLVLDMHESVKSNNLKVCSCNNH